MLIFWIVWGIWGLSEIVFSSLLSFIGFGISLNNWFSLITIASLVTIAFLYRIKIEEKTLIEQIGLSI